MRLRFGLTAMILTALMGLSTAEAADSRCAHTGDPGSCKALLERYRYDPGSGTCKEFFWGGCGSPNPFETKEECVKVCGGAKPLVLSEARSLSQERLPYLQISLDYPKDWAEPEFTVRVNGAEAPFRRWGGGFSPERQSATLLVFPGAAGIARIAVQATVGGKTYEAADAIPWNVWAMAGLLDGPGQLEAILKPRPLRFWAFPTDGLRVLFNGRSVSPKLAPLSGKPVGLYSIEPEWQPGKNTLTIEVTGTDKKRVVNEYSFVYAADGKVRAGESLAISYGTPGSKSGPFYSIELDGNALIPVGKGSDEEPYAVLDADGWVLDKTALVKRVKAERPGETRVRISVKRHFLQPVETEREFSVIVLPAAGK